jgi:hypothetical protein
MRFPQYLIAGLMFAIGLLPMVFLKPIFDLVSLNFHLDRLPEMESMALVLTKVSLMGLVLIVLVSLLMMIRKIVLSNRVTETGPTWGCGYTAGTSRQQYTGTSYANNLAELAQPVLQSGTEYKSIHEDDIFPGRRSFSMHPSDLFRKAVNRIIDFLMLALKKIARLQTGNIQHYILYAFVFIMIIFTLLYLRIL